MKERILISINLVVLLVFLGFSYVAFTIATKKDAPKVIQQTIIESVTVNDTLTISAVGDCTLGSDPRYLVHDSFIKLTERNNHDYGMYFRGVQSVFAKDDLTIANLENTFTDATERANKTFTFKAPPSYGQILSLGSVEVVNLANNHTYDFLEQGYKDTLKTLDDLGISYFGEDIIKIMEVKGVKIGIIGYYSLYNKNIKEDLDKGLTALKKSNVDLILVTFHWGIETHYRPQESQRELAKYAIDNGADLIIGHHPHRVQGLETYKGKHIVYSLGNFSFGGHVNPKDKDSFIVQMVYKLKNSKIEDAQIKIIPVSISSKKNVNDFQPQILEGKEKDRVLKKILDLSYNFEYQDE